MPRYRFRHAAGWVGILLCGLFPWFVSGQERFSKLVGNVRPLAVKESGPWSVPYLTWGGDVATFHANGGLSTKSGSTYQRLGLQLQMVPGDNFVGQVQDYLQGKTPFLRGTFHMLGQASEVLGADPSTKPVVILQLSWSAGDHIVARENIKTLNDLKRSGTRVRIACQQGGPHVGLLYDSLDAARIQRDEVDIVWVNDLTGARGPAEAFRKDPTLDACCVITPDMLGLTGGLDSAGTGAEGTVQGAHVVNSTQQMSRSIADVYAVRSDWYAKHKDVVEKFVAGYLHASQSVIEMRRNFERTQQMSPEYKRTLELAQQIFGKDVLPTLEVDAHGLLLDCSFVGLPGQITFFEDKGNLNGFESKLKSSLDLATNWGYAKARIGFSPASLDYKKLATLAGIPYEEPPKTGGRIEANAPLADDAEHTIVSFQINFGADQTEFSADQYGAEFMRAIQSASTFGNAAVVIRGHSDITRTMSQLVNAGIAKGLIVRKGKAPNLTYEYQGRAIDVTSPQVLEALIKKGDFEGTQYQPQLTLQQAESLSLKRAESVRDSLISFAERQGVNLDVSQIQATGIGIREPAVNRPRNDAEAAKNRRVEFRIVRVPAEVLQASDFDF